MVMEMPSPICVGREFVRQYYTMLHEAPEHLHRFYSHNSSFVHGGVEKPGEEQPPVTGQADIHKKIMSLNFHDCHAKIRQVDSQDTVGSAVVIQVTGELSNNGLPMRRFMQTFVLAPQSPKKYYVHNDIFRYQDEVFHDSDNDTEAQEETGDSEQEIVETSLPVEPVSDQTVTTYPGFSEPHQPALSNGSAHNEERVGTPEEKPAVAMEEDEGDAEEEKMVEEPEPQGQPQAMEDKEEPEKAPTPEPQPEPQVEAQKPFSWAALASKNTHSGGTNTAPPPQPQAVKPVQPMKPDVRSDTGPAPQPQRAPRPRPDRTRERDNSRGGEGEDTRRSRFPDSHQLFVGNLPQQMSEKELQKRFEEYGKVVDVRINRKSTNRELPNFGFVVFDEPDVVQRVLDNKPIMLNGDHRLNVEEKKQRGEQGRPGSGTRMGRGGGSMGGGPGRMGAGGRGGGRGGASVGGGPGRPDNRGTASGGGGGGGNRGGFGMPRR